MSDYVTPSTNYDEEIELTTGTDIVDGSPNSLVIGELTDDGGGGLDTFNPSDQINSAGTVRITGTGTDISFAGAVVQNTNAFEIRNFVTGELTFNAINWGVIPNWVSFNTSGDTAITNIAGAGNFSFIGGPLGSPASFTADFAPSAYSGASDDMSFWLDGANVEIKINTNSTGDVETGHFLAQSRDSMAYFNVTGMSQAFVTGDASNFALMQSSSSPISYLELVDSTGYDGNFSFMGYMGNGGALEPAMVITGDGANDLDLMGDGQGDLSVVTGDSADSVDIDTANNGDFWDVDLNLGKGADEASLYAGGDVNIVSGLGGDSIEVWDAFELVGAQLGAGNDYLYFNVTHDAKVNAGNRNDSVDGTAGNDANIFLGSGDNSASITAGGDAKIRSGNDDDNISVTASTTIDVLARDGNNMVDAFINGGDVFDFGKIVTGSGNDMVEAGGYSFDITTGGGADNVDIASVIDSAIVKMGGGGDELEVDNRGLLDVDSINFGGGSDTLTASDLDVLSGTGDFDVVNPGTLEWLSFGEASGDVSFDGVDTGANTAGVMNYHLTDPLTQNYDISNLVDGVSIFMSGASNTNIDLGLEIPGGVLNFQFTATNDHTFADFDLENVGTLNLTTVDNEISGVPTVVFGEKTSSFTDDSGVLSTVVLTGNTHITMGGVDAPNLSLIDGSAVTGNVDIQLIDVADTIEVLTGSGNDIVDGSAADSSLLASTGLGADSVLGGALDDVIETGGGNDTINAGAENDDIDMGAENDIAIFDEDELDSFDTIDGGLGIDTVEAGSSLGNQVDDFFFNWSNTEVLLLSSGGNNLTLNDIANQNGPDTIVSDGGDDKITLGSGYGRALEVQIQVGSNDDIDASGVTNGTGAVVVTGVVDAFNNDTIKGSGNGDELIMTADGMTADLTTGNVNDMTKITILKGGESDGATLITDGGVGFNDMLMVDASALIDDPLVGGPAGNFNFDGAGDDTTLISGDGDDTIATAGGKDDIETGKGDDIITSAGDNDVINSGEGDDSIEAGGGDDVVFAGAGNDTVFGGADNDIINGEEDDDAIDGDGGNDTIDGGLGDDTIEGANGADSLTGGLGADDFVYNTYNQSRGGNNSVDAITDFDQEMDQFDFSGLNGGGNVFLGNAESFGQAQGLLTGSAGEIVFQQDDMIVWMDDGDATLNGNDLQIDVSGVMMLDTDNFIGLA